jgi:hypothetical protein
MTGHAGGGNGATPAAARPSAATEASMTERAPPRVYSLAEIAAHLPVAGEAKERTVRDLIRKHKIPYHKVGRAVGLDDRQLGQLLEATTRCPIQPTVRKRRRSSSATATGTPMSTSASGGKASGLDRVRALVSERRQKPKAGSVVEFRK